MTTKKKRRKRMPYYEVTGEQLVHAMSMAEDKSKKVKKRWWRRVRRGEVISDETISRYTTNCQCSIDPTHCPIHGR
jgi:hypothetical protein